MSTTESVGPHIPPPQDQHRWLQQLIGAWTFEVQCGDDRFRGSENVRALGELWIVGEGRGPTLNGNEARNIITLGFDPARGRFVGTWVGSMMTHLWVYDGELDASGRVLSLYADGPKMDATGKPTGGTAKYKDVIEIISPNERTLTGHMQDDKGEWLQLMKATYRRA